jgi:hypothetical protein
MFNKERERKKRSPAHPSILDSWIVCLHFGIEMRKERIKDETRTYIHTYVHTCCISFLTWPPRWRTRWIVRAMHARCMRERARSRTLHVCRARVGVVLDLHRSRRRWRCSYTHHTYKSVWDVQFRLYSNNKHTQTASHKLHVNGTKGSVWSVVSTWKQNQQHQII